MNTNLKSLVQACNELGVVYQTYHGTQKVVELSSHQKSFLFVDYTTPLNPHSIVQLCVDKEYLYSVFHKTINMPKTIGFLRPDCDQKYFKYLKEKSYEEIVSAIEGRFQYPLIVKKNRGTKGSLVFKVSDRDSLFSSLKRIFNTHSNQFDYVALAQDCIDIKVEYRAIYLNGSLVFAYEKNIENAIYEGNLSPLHWHGAKAILVNDSHLLGEIDHFCSKLFQKMMIPYCGLDIVIDNKGMWWLIEANSSPGFHSIVMHGGGEKVIEMYKEIIRLLSDKEF